MRELARSGAEKLEEAEFTLRKIDEVAPREGEYEELEEALPRAEHAEALVAAASGAHGLVAGDDGASDALSAAVRALRDASGYDAKLGTWADALESSLIDIEDVASSLRDYADEVEWDPESLERMQQRLSRLEGLRRSFGPRMEDVFARREKAAAVVAASEGGDEAEKRARRALDAAGAALAMETMLTARAATLFIAHGRLKPAAQLRRECLASRAAHLVDRTMPAAVRADDIFLFFHSHVFHAPFL